MGDFMVEIPAVLFLSETLTYINFKELQNYNRKMFSCPPQK